MTLLLLASLYGCDYGFTLPSSTPLPTGISPGMKFPFRPRQAIIPASVTGPPPPDAGITSSQCSQITDGGPLEDDCLTGEIHCGDTIIGATKGGVKRYDTDFYEHAFCTPATTQHDGGDERVYRLDLPDPQMRALVYLDTPCADLDLAAIKSNSDSCPSAGQNISQCEMNIKSGTKREMVDLWNNNPSTWWIVVEGKDNEEGAFALTVQCLNW